jgi:hypothetical protein
MRRVSREHADRLRALSRKNESELHRLPHQRKKTEPQVNPPPTPSSIT